MAKKKTETNEKVFILNENQFGRIVKHSNKGYLIEDFEGYGKYYERKEFITEKDILGEQKK